MGFQVVGLTASTGKLVDEDANDETTDEAHDSSNWDRGSRLTNGDAADENNHFETCIDS